MLSQDNLQTASKYSEKAHTLLNTHQIAANPLNYSIAYFYSCQRLPQLCNEIDLAIAAKKPIDGIFFENLFEKYISNNEQFDSTYVEPFKLSLDATVAKIDLQVNSGRKVASNLEKVDKALGKTEHHQSLKGVVGYLMDTIHVSKTQYEYLSNELAKASQEVSTLKTKLQESRQEASLDNLTGLLNRRGFENKLQDLLIDEGHSSLMIDIDHFKSINDNFGHMIGDKVLQRVAGVIKQYVSADDLAVRFGGEEFLVLMVNKAVDEASLIAEKIRRKISELKLVQRQSQLVLPPISVSIGIAEFDRDPDWQDMFKRADDALYLAKNSGRNRCVLA
jgi:diguanylate cyclase